MRKRPVKVASREPASGAMLAREGHLDEGFAHFEKAVSADPTNGLAQNNYGAALLQKGLEMVYEEDINPLWIAVRLGPTTFGIFDAFPNETQRQQHLDGPIAAAVIGATDLLAKPLSVEPFDLIGGKIAPEVIDQAVPKAA